MKQSEKDLLRLALAAVEFRSELDALLTKYKARLVMGWYGKWCKLQVQFPTENDRMGVTVMEVCKDRRVRYMTEAEELEKERRK